MALVSEACASYKYCHCTNEDGSANDNATASACGNYTVIHDQAFAECKHYTNNFWWWTAYTNCEFRERCNKNGAAGDSSCRAKVHW
ncbi:hypothetical protein LZ32DRAFT_610894 [Colletotrichum eremochloae]|nr:hypothetical protein LZ32DRAFT_610894 [Colletotrichum eremochloae]